MCVGRRGYVSPKSCEFLERGKGVPNISKKAVTYFVNCPLRKTAKGMVTTVNKHEVNMRAVNFNHHLARHNSVLKNKRKEQKATLKKIIVRFKNPHIQNC